MWTGGDPPGDSLIYASLLLSNAWKKQREKRGGWEKRKQRFKRWGGVTRMQWSAACARKSDTHRETCSIREVHGPSATEKQIPKFLTRGLMSNTGVHYLAGNNGQLLQTPLYCHIIVWRSCLTIKKEKKKMDSREWKLWIGKTQIYKISIKAIFKQS